MPLPSVHPVTLTARDLRRSITRLVDYQKQNPEEPFVGEIISHLREANSFIPQELKEVK